MFRLSQDGEAGRPSAQLRALVEDGLRPEDDAVLLPGAGFSREELTFQNAVFALHGDAADVPFSKFDEQWGVGVSAVRLPPAAASAVERLLADPAKRRAALAAAAAALPSETSNDAVEIGPSLKRTGERDDEAWTAGLTPGAFAGIYKTTHEVEPAASCDIVGMARESAVFYAVAKAGAGRAAAELHARICGAARDGRSLASVWGEELGAESGLTGAEAHQRTLEAGRRNRGRILHRLLSAIGIADSLDSVADHAAAASEAAADARVAILHLDCVTNCISTFRRGDLANDADPRPGDTFVYFANAIDGNRSEGMAILSNAAAGVKLIVPNADALGSLEARIAVPPNGCAFAALPFNSLRVQEDASALAKGPMVHVDRDWLRERFACQPPTGFSAARVVEDDKIGLPAPLWGTHTPEAWSRQHASALGVASRAVLALRPEIVVMAATDAAKL